MPQEWYDKIKAFGQSNKIRMTNGKILPEVEMLAVKNEQEKECKEYIVEQMQNS